jgi:hypothetical protein
VLPDESLVDPSAHQHLAQQTVHQRLVRPAARREVHVRFARDGRVPWIDGEESRRIGPAASVEHPHPQHRLGLGDVVAEQRQRVAVIDVGVRAGLSVAAEGGL